jgi:hypothetical protein
MVECSHWAWFWAGVLTLAATCGLALVALVIAAEWRGQRERDDPPRFL